MELTVLLFGPASVALNGQDSVRIPLQPASTVADLTRALHDHFPPLRPMLASGRFAVNHAFAAANHPLHPTDEIALIAMVSGG